MVMCSIFQAFLQPALLARIPRHIRPTDAEVPSKILL